MIKSKNGRVRLRGEYAEISADFSATVEAYVSFLEEKKGMTREDAIKKAKRCFEVGTMTYEEVHAEAQQILGELLMHLGETMVDGLNDKEEGEQADE